MGFRTSGLGFRILGLGCWLSDLLFRDRQRGSCCESATGVNGFSRFTSTGGFMSLKVLLSNSSFMQMRYCDCTSTVAVMTIVS